MSHGMYSIHKWCETLSMTQVRYNWRCPTACILFTSDVKLWSPFLTGRTISSPNMVRTVRRTILRFWIERRTNSQIAEQGSDSSTNYTLFLNWLINEMQASARTSLWRLYTDTREPALTRHMQPVVHSRPKASAMDSTAVPRAHLFISLYLLGPTDNADPPTSQQMRPFPLKREAENVHTVSHVLLSQFSLLPYESSQVSTNQTQGSTNTTNSSQSMSNKAFWTPNTASSHFVEQTARTRFAK